MPGTWPAACDELPTPRARAHSQANWVAYLPGVERPCAGWVARLDHEVHPDALLVLQVAEEPGRDQPLVSAAINVTRAVSSFMGLVIQVRRLSGATPIQ